MVGALALLAIAATELTWLAPEVGCPSRAEVLERLRASLGPEEDLEVTARIERVGARWRLRLETRAQDAIGARELTAPDCAALADATVLLATMAARAPEPAPSSADAPDSAAGPASGAEARPEPAGEVEAPEEGEATAGSAERTLRGPWSLGLGVRFDGGRLPTEVPGVQLDGAWSRGPWSVGARIFGWLPSAGVSSQGAEPRFLAVGVGALGCAGLPWVVRPEACLAVDLWTLRGSATGVTDPAEPWAPQVSVAARLQATWPAEGAWALRLAGELAVELNPARFRVEPLGEVHRVERWLPSGSASVVFRP